MSSTPSQTEMTFDEILEQLSGYHDDANQMMNEGKSAETLSPLLSEINYLYCKLELTLLKMADDSAKSNAESKMLTQHAVKARFDEVVGEYLHRRKVNVKDISSVISVPRTLRSMRSDLSRRSSASCFYQAQSMARKKVAALKLSHLQEKLQLERDEEELQRRSAEQRRKRRELDATHELKEASLEHQVMEEELQHGGYISDEELELAEEGVKEETPLHLPATLHKGSGTEGKLFSPECTVIESKALTKHSTAVKGNKVPLVAERKTEYPDAATENEGKINSTGSASNVFQEVVVALKSSMDCPKLELQRFNGDPMKYHRFKMTFEATIENSVAENRRLLYLLQYCEGKAKNVIEHCALLDPCEGYKRAKEILFDNFGRRNVIARSYISKLVKGPAIRSDDSSGFIKLAQELEECNTTLQFMKYYSDINNFDNIAKIVGRLSFYLQSRWIRFSASVEKKGVEPTFEDLVKFVREEAEIARSSYSGALFKTAGKKPGLKVATHAISVTEAKGKFDSKNKPNNNFQANASRKLEAKCTLCSLNHVLWNCAKFKAKSLADKQDFVREYRLCFNCLRKNHMVKDCPSQFKCTIAGCGKKHHSLLHRDQPANQSTQPKPKTTDEQKKQSSSSADGASEQSECYACFSGEKNKAFLNVVPVRISSGKNNICCYAFLDQGSTTSLCDRRLLDELNIAGKEASFSLTTLNNSVAHSGRKVDLSVSALNGGDCLQLQNVLTVNKLPVKPNPLLSKGERSRWPHLQRLNFPSLGKHEVRLLIGVDAPQAFWIQEERRGKPGEPYAVKTILGWSLLGPTGRGSAPSEDVSANFVRVDERLEEQVQRMWKLEDCLPTHPGVEMSRNDRYALKIIENSTQVTDDGHYQVALPWRPGAPQLHSNKSQAMIRLSYLKKRLERDTELQQRYVTVVLDYISKGYARKITEEDDQSPGRWFLPHHPVFHPHKPNKVRVVFDCGARYGGKSLNEQLLKGPDLMNNLVGVLTRFRKENIALVADVEAMFHQVRVDPKDCTYLRFLWWPDGDLSKPVEEYCMQVHIFGAASSPFCANFCLKQAATDQAKTFDSETISTVKHNFYMDDCLKSVSSEEEAKKMVSELMLLLQNRGFRLTKWLSNKPKVLSNLKKEDIAEAAWNPDKLMEPCQRILGVQWDYVTDNFDFKVQVKEKPKTKRGILSVIASLFDPLGLVAPTTLFGKILFQELCRKGLKWDEAIPEEEASSWEKWLRNLDLLTQLKVPRCLIPQGGKFGSLAVELHTFCDASSKAYAAVCYLKTFDFSGAVHCKFVMGKCRLAPIKTISIPRLELMGAALAVKLALIVKQELGGEKWNSYFWTDSTAVLYMINNSCKRFPVFVANRLSKIDEGSNPCEWRYVDSKSNPADDATRGIPSANLTADSRWLSGPPFLYQSEECWPSNPCEFPPLPEEFVILQKPVTCMNVGLDQITFDIRFSRYSSWQRLRTSIAWILRLKAKLRKKSVPEGSISIAELEEAERVIFASVQQTAFAKEMNSLSSLGKSSPLRKVHPVMHHGLLRVGGRLRNASEDFSVKHPIILPSGHHVTRLLIEDHHRIKGHSGMAITWTSLRQQFWIIKGAATVRKYLNKCLFCRKRNASVGIQLMADLPEGRLTTNNPPFYVTGVDYFGPFEVKQGRSIVKRYGCLFTCLTSRAVHIEVAPSLTADAFINALRRFVSRRGLPHTIHSDNGTNLVGGCRELRDAVRNLNRAQVHSHLRQQNIQWKFNPPQASHMGGIWERQIRSTRRIFNALLSSQTLSDDLLVTLMAEAESIINSRPLTPIVLDPEAKEPLTPNHLLLMRSSTSPPGLFKNTDCYSHKRWRQVQYLANQFWIRWRREYMQTLQLRHKWQKSKRNFAIDDLVLLQDDNAPRGSWPLGRVIEVFPDKLNRVRQVTVKTQHQTLKRPISKLCHLPLAN